MTEAEEYLDLLRLQLFRQLALDHRPEFDRPLVYLNKRLRNGGYHGTPGEILKAIEADLEWSVTPTYLTPRFWVEKRGKMIEWEAYLTVEYSGLFPVDKP